MEPSTTPSHTDRQKRTLRKFWAKVAELRAQQQEADDKVSDSEPAIQWSDCTVTGNVLELCTSPIPAEEDSVVTQLTDALEEISQRSPVHIPLTDLTDHAGTQTKVTEKSSGDEYEPTLSTRTGPKSAQKRKHEEARSPNIRDRPIATPHPDTGTITLPVAHGLCWRCGRPGHLRISCNRKAILFCSRCGKVGVQSRYCDCRGAPAKRPRGSTRRTEDVNSEPCPTCGCPYKHWKGSQKIEERKRRR